MIHVSDQPSCSWSQSSKLTPITDHDSDRAVHCSWYSVVTVADGGGSSACFEPVD